MDKKQIENILDKATKAKKEQIKKTELDLKKQHDDFLTLIKSSVNFNRQLEIQWTNKVFDNPNQPVEDKFDFNIRWDEYGITENTQNIFAEAIKSYLYELGFLDSDYGKKYYINKQKEPPIMCYERIIKFNLIKCNRTRFIAFYWYKKTV